jgi:hypothetical protein
MGAVRNLYEEPKRKRTMFTIPLQTEVQKYMRDKMGWPERFCEVYANKFWNFYQSKGWIVGRVQMKDWKAAFNAQWQHLRDNEMIKLLSEEEAKERAEKAAKMTVEERLNEILSQFAKCKYDPPKEHWQRMYEVLKGKGLMKLPKDQIEEIREAAGNSMERAREMSVKRLFTNMVNGDRKF